MCMPFPGTFSINQLFLFSENVSWTVIDCGEPSQLLEWLQSIATWRAGLGAKKSLRIRFHIAADLPAWGGGLKEKINEHP